MASFAVSSSRVTARPASSRRVALPRRARAAACSAAAAPGGGQTPREASPTPERDASPPPADEPAEEYKIFVGNLSWSTDNESLEQAFGAHGNLLDAVVIMDRDDPSRSRGFGFVKFEKEADMKAAIEALNETDLDGRQIRANRAGDASPPAAEPAEPSDEYKIFVGNLSWSTDNESLEQAFGAHGNLLDAVVIMDRDDPSRSRGFGFVKFEKEADMKAAIEALNETDLDGRQIRANRATPGGGGRGGGRGRGRGGGGYGGRGGGGRDRYAPY